MDGGLGGGGLREGKGVVVGGRVTGSWREGTGEEEGIASLILDLGQKYWVELA